ncbi:Protein of unknown function [Pyronema omphalodes CBS 100304]|uniref:Uncharacterized protein n=1 Tax=Pyronema omphalodes (strain CBS 100304) TaxID=1076935 RepID=U4KZC5_PYROM|nr:Protein of unknown function [Pyronema omphalodes CBS 100304]
MGDAILPLNYKSFFAVMCHDEGFIISIELNVAPSPNSAQYHSDIPDVPSLPAGAHASSTALTSEFNDLSISSMANGDGSPQLGGISSTRGYFDVDETASDYVPTYTTPPKGVMTTIKEEEEEEEPAPTKPAGDSYISARQRYQETGESMSKSATMGYISPITRKPLVPKVPRSPTAAPTFNIPRKSVPGSPVLASCSVSAAEFTATVEAVVAGPSSAVSAATHLAIPAMPQGFTHRGRMVNYASIDTALVKSGGMRRLSPSAAPTDDTPTDDTAASGLDGYEDAEEGDEEAQDSDDDSDENDDNEASLAFQA